MTLKKNINAILTVFVISFVAAGLAVVPSLQEANANELTLFKDKPKKSKDKGDFIIDEPVIKLVKDKPKKAKDKD